MNFKDFTNKIDHLKVNQLGGRISQFKLVPELRIKISEEKIKNSNPRKAAVLALFYPDEYNETRFILTERASYNGAHSSQISFPGGKIEKSDTNLKETALRETHEEIGIARSSVKIIRQLSETYIPPSNFIVTPFLGITEQRPIFKPNNEVAKLIEVLATDLIDDTNLSLVEMETSYMKKIEVPCFTFNNYIVWGATAMMLSEIKDLLKDIH
ncbi:NUDIX domain-containing protein [Tenacibaculum adriaticum]|uniref:NUDIX domain-containing protein n=1 Tax=Tenacibaculum adriaticum TaxID=413713 RepID=A0A5S5DS66_9FLAO|nr:CoA pyrophosphatase [Tenacibaculum adriaticum]TYP98727.1 NUDIX domain-containing protein [Tenacibaculum adriaticum]